MKKILMALMIVPSLAFGNLTVHQDEFSLETASQGSHFWARLYDWSAWSETEKQKSLKLNTNFVKQAYDDGDDEVDTDGLDEDGLISLLGPVEGPALFDFYENREEVDPEDIGKASGLTTAIKVAVDLPDDFDIEGADLNKIYDMISMADQPHIHTEVNKDFVHNFVDPLHSAHKAVDQLKNGRIVLSTVNTGSEYYACPSMNTVLKFKGEIEGVSTYDGDFRAYIINTVTELDVNKDLSGKTLIEGTPSRVFEQKIIYSSTLIKSGVNYLAFYNQPNGKKKMVLNAIIVSTDKVKEVPGNFVNGVGITNDIFSGIKFKNGEAVLNAKNVDLSPLRGNCSKGLAQGVGRYVLNLANSMVK